MSAPAYYLSGALSASEPVGVSDESQTILRNIVQARAHLAFPAYRDKLQRQGYRAIGPESACQVIPLLANVETVIKQLTDPRMQRQAKLVLEYLRTEISLRDLSSENPLRAILSEDGSLQIEWLRPDRRLGFTIEPNQDDSGWYYASSRTAGGRCASGSLAVLNVKQLLDWMTGKS